MKHFLLPFHKIIVTFMVSMIGMTTLFATTLYHFEESTLFEHLVEVNKEWNNQHDIDWQALTQRVSFKNDRTRIQYHLKMVEQTLRQRDVLHLTKAQRQKRLHHLNVLKTYWQEGLFPTNTEHQKRQPYFVDIYGVYCAVGYLLHKDGQQQFVEKVRKQNNCAYIKELTVYPELETWATANGFSIEELAWIQPGYPPPAYQIDPVGNGGGIVGSLHVMYKNNDETMLYLGGNFTSVDGQMANNIIGWDGSNWHILGNGVDGTVNAIEIVGTKVYIAGNFELDGQIVNIAVWEDNSWTPLQTGDMQGEIYVLKHYNGRLYVGGDFQQVNGVAMPYLAIWYAQTWTNGATHWINGASTTIPNAFSVNNTVRCFEIVANQLLVGGDFTQTAPNTVNPVINQLSANYLAYWSGNNWTIGLEGEHAPVHSLKYHLGALYVGGDITENNPLAVLTAGLWIYPQGFFGAVGDGIIHDFFIHNNRVFITGGFQFSPGVGSFGGGMVELDPTYYYLDGALVADNAITAGLSFQDKAYWGGDFTSINNQSLNGLAVSELDVSSSTPRLKPDEKAFDVFHASRQLHIRHDSLKETAAFYLYNVEGCLIHSATLNEGSTSTAIGTNSFSDGVYFYQIVETERRESGQIGVF